MRWLFQHYRGLLLTFLIAVVSYCLGSFFPLIGGPVFAILIGIIFRSFFGTNQKTEPGIIFSSKNILQISIILLGCGLNLNEIYKTGTDSFTIILITLSTALTTSYLIGKILKIDFKLNSLIGVGTAICGGSAIAAIAPIIEAKEQDIAFAISTIFLFNIAAVFVFPPLGHLLGMSEPGFGLLAGTAINDTSSVVAAGYIYGNTAGDSATIVKLTRTLMILPISLIFVMIMNYKKNKTHKNSLTQTNNSFNFLKLFPWFIIGFILFSVLRTTNWVNNNLMIFLKDTGKFLIIMALGAIGLKTDIQHIFKTGLKPGLLGMLIWVVLTLTSLGIQWIEKLW